MLTDIALVAGGIFLLAYAGDTLVDFAAAIAHRARLTAAVIGMTVVALGTSAPELAVSMTASFEGAPGIVLGNVVGSNVANIALILGICAIVSAVPISAWALRFDYPVMLLASFVAFLLVRDGEIDRLEASFFLLSVVAFVAYSLWVARREVSAYEERDIAELLPEDMEQLKKRSGWMLAVGVLLGLAGLAAGSRFLVLGATGIAELFGISDRVIGLTVVAVGTSLPELVASLAAAMKKHTEMAFANIVGSNIFNLFLILGATAGITPIPVDARIISLDMPVMIAMTVLLLPMVWRGSRITRAEGIVLLLSWIAYTSYLIFTPQRA